MRQIFNWVGGGFFRTIGRTLAFLALGALAYYLFSKSSFDIKDLFFDSVNAAEYVDGQDISYYSDQALTNRLPSNGWYDYATINSTTTPNGDFTSTNFWTTPYIYTNDIHSGEITIPFYIAVPRVSTTTTSTIYGQDYCDRWTWGSIDSYNNVIRWDCSHIDQGQDNTITDREYITPQISIQAMVGYENGYIDICRVDTNKNEIVCPIVQNIFTNNIVAITIQSRVYFTSNSTYQYYVGLYRKINRFSNSTNAIIDSQNHNAQQIIEQQQNSTQQIMDTNSTETDETATSFFDDFQDTDHGGLSSIITAPLVVINEMLNGVCVQPSATWKGATISLPCGDMLWSRNGASDLKNLLNIFYGGIICYYAIRKLFMMIEGLKDPTQDRIEVTDL